MATIKFLKDYPELPVPDDEDPKANSHAQGQKTGDVVSVSDSKAKSLIERGYAEAV